MRLSQFLENLWKFWNGPLWRNKSGPFPPLSVAGYWKSSNTKAFAKKLSRILANNIDHGGKGIDLRIYVRYCLKNWIKNKKGLEKTCHFFQLQPTIMDVCHMSNGFMTNWVTPWPLWPSKKLKWQNYGEI